MPAKGDGGDKEKCLELFLKIGLDERTAKNTIANNKVTSNLTAVITEAGVTDGCSRAVGNLLYTVATKYPANALVHRPILLQYIVSSRIKTTAQLDAALSFLSATASDNLDLGKFEESCGVGVEVSVEEIKRTVDEVFEENKTAIVELRYRTNVGELLGHVRRKHPWADAKVAKQLVDAKLFELLGERTAADDEKPARKKKEKPAKVEDKPAAVPRPEKPSEEDLNPYLIFPNPEENLKVHTEVPFSDGSILRCCNTKELLDKHLKATGGKVLTRFPPEPNGYLHIGHAKAMFIDFGLAKDKGGGCYLRYDDTNPEAEKKEYIDHILEIVQWMGWKPFKITYTSDYFQELYELAVELIRRGHAYVDHQTPDEIKEYREKKMNSPWRDRPIAESLKLFEDMRRGLIEEGKATLRMKQDMQSDNYNMYDLIAYRIKFAPHPHAGDKWCIYPSYDYAHCIVDSLENVTHSLCTLEFETRRASYYWLLHALGLYQPYVWEYSRLNVSNMVMSKRKLNCLVTEKWIRNKQQKLKMAPTTIPLTALAGEKTLQSRFIRDEDERPKVAYNNFSNEIPVISLAGIDEVDGRKGEICRKIVEACEDWGVFQVVDHGIDTKLISEMTSLAKEFFALPPEEKLRYDMSGGKKGGFLVSSHLQGEAVEDWREIVIYFSYPKKSRDYSRWPDKPEGWKEVTEEYGDKLMGLACKLLEVLSEAMGLDKEALTKACVDMDQKIVVNFYPKCPQPDLTLGLKRHTDPGTITLLLQDQVGGLQATRDNGKTWITVQPIEGAFVVNLGDHGHYLSNGRFKNADHQAVVNSECSRLSIATFQNPAPEAIVYPLKVREGEEPVLKEPITFMEMYRKKMGRDLELAKQKKLAREQQQQVQQEKANFESKPIEQILA